MNLTKLMRRFQLDPQLPGKVLLEDVESIPLHIHDGVELVYVLRGRARVKISFNFYEMNPGDFLLINSFEIHGIQGMDGECRLLMLQLDSGLLKGHPFAFDYDFYQRHHQSKVHEVKELLSQIYLLQNAPKGLEKAGGNLAAQWIKRICLICDAHFQIHEYDMKNKKESAYSEHPVNRERLKEIYAYLYVHFREKIRLEDMAEMLHLDKFYLSHIIKTGMGLSLQKTLNIIRADRAEIYLLATDHTVQRISEELGFSSLYQFNKTFKEYYNLTPNAYRKIYKGNTFPDAPLRSRHAKVEWGELERLLRKSRETIIARDKERTGNGRDPKPARIGREIPLLFNLLEEGDTSYPDHSVTFEKEKDEIAIRVEGSVFILRKRA